MKKSFWFLIFSSVIVICIMWFASPLVAWIRPEFAESVLPLRVLILGFPVFFISSLGMWYVIAKKRQRDLMVIHGIAMIGNVIANIIYIPRYGYMAAAFITIFSELVVLGMTGIVVYAHDAKKEGVKS